jgi:hypothetical protein
MATAAGIGWLSLDARSSGLAFASGAVALAAVLQLAAALVFARPGWIGVALGLLALLFFEHAAATGDSDVARLGLASVGLLLTGELAQWSLDSRLPGRYDAGLHRSRAGGIGLLLVVGFGAVVLSEFAAGVPVPVGLGTMAVAAAAAVALLALISNVALRRLGE